MHFLSTRLDTVRLQYNASIIDINPSIVILLYCDNTKFYNQNLRNYN